MTNEKNGINCHQERCEADNCSQSSQNPEAAHSVKSSTNKSRTAQQRCSSLFVTVLTIHAIVLTSVVFTTVFGDYSVFTAVSISNQTYDHRQITLVKRQLLRRKNATALKTRTPTSANFVRELDIATIERSANCSETFLQHYEQFCEAAFTPTQQLIKSESDDSVQDLRPLCACVPRQWLLGHFNPLLPPPKVTVNSSSAPINESSTFGVDVGGHWAPKDCKARQRLAIIVPVRDRESHLQILVKILHPMLQRQLIEYTIFAVEQDRASPTFNKASLMNAGFKEIHSRSKSPTGDGVIGGPFDCFLFHDVDMLPEDDRNFYGCGARLPRHVAAYIDKWAYKLYYFRMFGGATSFRPHVFEHVNGFSNEFYGWGGEDDDMLRRIEAKGMWFIRFPRCVATYRMIKHHRDSGNPGNKKAKVGRKFRPMKYVKNGLSSVRYTLLSLERLPLYTKLFISIPPKPNERKRKGGRRAKGKKPMKCNPKRRRKGKC